jgi:hypothetical protein
MRPADIPRVRTWEEFTALGLAACDLVLVEGSSSPIPAFLAERLLPPPAAPPRSAPRHTPRRAAC